MSALRKMGVYLGLVEDADRYDPSYEDYDDGAGHPEEDTVGVEREQTRGTVATLPRRRVEPVADVNEVRRITNLTPRSYNDAREVGEHFRDGVPVIMNLTQMDDGDAKRLVDFAAGLIFGCRGTIERVTSKVFLLSPADMEVTAEDKALIAEGGFFNQS